MKEISDVMREVFVQEIKDFVYKWCEENPTEKIFDYDLVTNKFHRYGSVILTEAYIEILNENPWIPKYRVFDAEKGGFTYYELSNMPSTLSSPVFVKE